MSKTARTNLTIVTFNTQGVLAVSLDYFRKCDAFAAYMNTHDIDICNLQEVFFHQHLHYLKKKLTAFPYCSYRPSVFGPQAGLVTFSRSPIKRHSHVLFSKVGNLFDRSIISMLGKKGVLISRHKATGLFIMNTHFSANFSNDWNSDNRDTRVLGQQVNEFQREVAKIPGVGIMTGDFNIQKHSYLYREMMQAGVDDAFGDYIGATHRGDVFVASGQNLQLDYVFFSKDRLLVKDSRCIFDKKVVISGKNKQFISDHVGLQVTFTVCR